MKNFEIEESYYSPCVHFDIQRNEFSISGELLMEPVHEFYEPMIQWLDKYLLINQISLHFQICLTYCNISPSASIFEILQLLQSTYTNKDLYILNWLATPNDEDLMEQGALFKEDFQELPFELKVAQIEI
ncbi:hypothetical protein BKI52_28735 [marine bacterium AO1-C]|nr:hypothetical protein BKI52_28735 [marine bacterium AO1-C]